MSEPRRVVLPEIETGNDAADRIYRRLLERRRRLVEPALERPALDGPAARSAIEAGAVLAEPLAGATGAASAGQDFASATTPGTSAAFGDPPRTAIDPEGPFDDMQHDPRQDTRQRPRPGDRPMNRHQTGILNPHLADWHPQSQTMRFLKEHPALALAIGIPTVVILARNGSLKRIVRYASSPAGMARIRQGMALAATLGLLNKRR